MRLWLRIAFAALAALLLFGFWEGKLFAQTIWTPVGANRLILVTLAYTAMVGAVVWRRPGLRLPVIDWFEIPIGAAVIATAFGLGAHFPINYPWVWAPVVAGFLAYLFRLRRMRDIAMTRLDWAASGLAGFPLTLYLLAAMSPESSGDGLAMHLVIPEWIAYFHSWSFDAARLAWAVMPMNGDWMSSVAFLAGGEYAPKALNWIWLVVLCGGIFRVLRAHLAREWAWFGVALFASTPIILLITGSLFVENLWALLLFAGFLALWEERPIASAVLLGAAMATKFGSLAMIVVVLPLVVWRLKSVKRIAMWAAVFGAFACVPYVTAYVITGNPLFPFFNGVFHSPLFEDWTMIDPRFPRGVSWRILYDLVIHSSRHMESLDGVAGFQWLLFLPLALLGWKSLPSFGRVCLVGGLAFLALEFQGLAYLRYAYPGLVLLAIPVALSVRQDRWFAFAAVGLFALNIYFLGGSGFQHRDLFLNWFSAKEREDFSQFYIPQRRLVAELNRIAPGQPVAFLAGNQIAGVCGPAYSATWHSWKFENALRKAASPEDVLKLIEKFEIRFVIAPVESSAVQLGSVQAREMLNLCTATKMEYGGFRLASVLDMCRNDSRPPAKPGSYDDKDMHIVYRGAWTRDSQFAETSGHTVTYSATPGESFRMSFEGSRITWVFTKASNRGIVQVLIDGVEREQVDLYSAKPEWQARKTFEVPVGTHMFEVRVTGRKNPAAKDVHVDVDALIVE